ncbi:hypothetical protein ACFL0D_06610 [Thermoproteota archaeon]
MPKIDENIQCHFLDTECVYPIPEDVLLEALENADEDETIHAVPAIDESLCTNCLLATLIELINQKIK